MIVCPERPQERPLARRETHDLSSLNLSPAINAQLAPGRAQYLTTLAGRAMLVLVLRRQWNSPLPQPLEPATGDTSVAYDMLRIAVAKVILHCPQGDSRACNAAACQRKKQRLCSS
jgi:hypothetical protein